MQVLAIAIAAWFVAHLIKFSLHAFKDEPDLRWFYRSGSMPSGHAAAVTALTVATFMLAGAESPLFGVTAVLAGIVIYDTLGMRRSVGEQAVALNAVSDSDNGNHVSPVREVPGHTPREVMVGIAIGAAVGLVSTYSVWVSETGWLTTTPGAEERLTYLILFLALVGAGIVLRLALLRQRNVAIVKRLVSQVWWSFVLPGAIGLFFSLLQFQASGNASGRVWTILVVIAIVMVQGWLYVRVYRGFRETYRQQVAERKRRRRQQRKRGSSTSKNTKKRKK